LTKFISTVFLLFLSIFLFGQIKNSIDDGRKIRLPIVFHVIFKNSNQNINDSLILKELQDLNFDFKAMNDMSLLENDFRNDVGNPNLEFYLLDTIIQSGGIPGIQRIKPRNFKSRNELLINPEFCLNIFISSHHNSSGILSDRINLNYKNIGKNRHTLTHETGHWLGLYHIFGQIKNSAWWRVAFGNRDDLIDDTPEQKGATAICYSVTDDCPCPPKKIYFKESKRMYNNFMDYNPCRCMFTKGQVIKMRNNIIEHKSILFDKSKK
jgi:hypothetical protein